MKPISRLLLLAAVVASACSRPAPVTAPAPVVAPPVTTTPTPGGRGAPTPGTPTPGDSATPGGRGGLPPGFPGAGGPGAEPVPRPYATVIRGADLRTRAGMFKTHRIGANLFFEIPRSELGKDMIMTVEIERAPAGSGFGGTPAGDEVIRWERRDNRILLRSVSYAITASDTTNPIRRAVDNANYAPIIRAFNIEAWSPGDSSAVINVTSMFTTAIPQEISINRGGVDGSRTFLNSVAAFPGNIEIRSDVTTSGGGPAPAGIPAPFGVGGGRPSSTYLVHWSMVKLPEQPMMPRLFDARVGYFTNSTVDFSRPDHEASTRTFITRYRLECSDAPKVNGLCVPKKPITWYVDPATPTLFVPWVKKAIESWQPAFEAAGFYKGIVAKEAPSRAEDPDWAIEDARYSVVDWLPSSVANAQGPHLADPRTGEILSAHVQLHHNVMSLNRNWYFVQAGAVDPRATQWPQPDSLAGRLMQLVVAHEIGHSLGFQHNMKASSLYPVDSIRNASFVKRMGHTPTLMDYSRFNYVAQPEDKIDVNDLVPVIGPYDKWATKWGYAPIPGAKTPEDERPTLDAWAREQDTKPWLRFSTSGAAGTDFGDNTEAVGDADAVRATGYGIKNLKRIVPLIAKAATKPTEDVSDLRELYTAAFNQWRTELMHVVPIVGGVDAQEKYGSQPGARFTPLTKARQRNAVEFLNEQAFRTPTFFLDPAILSRIEPNGAISRVSSTQSIILSQLMSNARIARLIEFEATLPEPGGVYTATDLFTDVRRGIFEELSGSSVKVDAFRRLLQSAYIDLLKAKIEAPPPAPALTGLPAGVTFIGGGTAINPDIRALARLELARISADAQAAERKAGDDITRAHLLDMRVEIDEVLNPKK